MEIDLRDVVAQISKDKGIERDVLVEALEAAILAAARRVFGPDRELETRFSEDTGQIDLFQYLNVVDEVENDELEITIEQAKLVDSEAEVGDELGFQIFYRAEDKERAQEEESKFGDILGIAQARGTFGRIAAQAAKQVITHRVRTAEREIIYNEYHNRKHELVTGIARRFERGDIVVDLGRAEALLPLREQVQKESYRAGDRVQAFVLDVLDSEHSIKGAQIILSRRHPFVVVKLFEVEVPEIYEGIVKIVSVAREAGERTKIAVTSTDSDVDPVGACVGMRGARVQAVVQELKGEKIDIVPYSPDLGKFVCNAIAPAEVARVLIDEDSNSIELIVPDDQLSLAIGRRGQNVKLASQLVGWNIEIHSEAQIQELKEEIKANLVGAGLIDEMDLDYMFKVGLHSVENILAAEDEELMGYPGINEENLGPIRDRLEILQEDRLGRMEAERAARRAAIEAERQAIAEGRIPERSLSSGPMFGRPAQTPPPIPEPVPEPEPEPVPEPEIEDLEEDEDGAIAFDTPAIVVVPPKEDEPIPESGPETPPTAEPEPKTPPAPETEPEETPAVEEAPPAGDDD
jgi:N utilization substance protein A